MLPSDVVRLGRTPVVVSRLGLGTAPFGALPIDRDDEAHAIVRRAAGAGIRFMDTAPIYGLGRAESRIGAVMPELDRAQLTISTKVGLSPQAVGFTTKVTGILREAARHPKTGIGDVASSVAGFAMRAAGRHPEGGLRRQWPAAMRDFSFDGTLRSVDTSLRRLGTDSLDILLIHNPIGPIGPVLNGAYRALERLRNEGTVLAIGVGSNDAARLEAYARAADFDCLLLGYRYTLMDQTAERSLLPYAHARGIPVVVGGPFNSGILADPGRGARYDNRAATAAELRRARSLEAIAGRHGLSLKAAALQFPFTHPVVASVLVGVQTVAELDENVDLMRGGVPDALWEEYRHEGLLAETALPAV